MSSLAVSKRSLGLEVLRLTEESLTVGLMGAPLLCPWLGILVCGMARQRSAITLRFLEMGRTFTGPIWMRI